MLGQGIFDGVVDFCAGAGVVGVEGDGVEVVGVEVVGAAAAPAMPTTAPAVASAPATITALSVLEICMCKGLQWWAGTLHEHYAPPT
jgi:hypothetical protein